MAFLHNMHMCGWSQLRLHRSCLVPIVALQLACGGSDSAPPTSADSATGTTTELVLSDSPVVVIGGRDDREAYQLSHVVGALRLSDGRIVVADGQSRLLRYYDADGVHLATVAGEGSGPGEFQRLSSISRGRGDTVVAWDARHRRISLFQPDGEFSSVVGLPALTTALAKIQRDSPRHIIIPDAAQRLNDGTVVVSLLAEPYSESGQLAGLIQDTVPLILLSPGGDSGIETGKFPGMEFFFHDGSGRIIPFGEVRHVVATGQAVFVASSVDRDIRILSPSTGEIAGTIAIPGARRPVSPQDVSLTRRRLTEGASGRAALRATEFVDAVPFPDSMPVLSGLRIGSDERVWVQRYRAPMDSTQQWLAFTPSGNLELSITMASDLQLLDAGERYLLVQVTDELDVQQIRMYRMQPAAGRS